MDSAAEEISLGWDHGKVFILCGNPSNEQIERFRRECEENDRQELEEWRRAYRCSRLADLKHVLEEARDAGGIKFTGDWDLELDDNNRLRFVVSARAVERTVEAAQLHFAKFSWLVPHQVWQEETGDALESIAAMKKAGCSGLKIMVKVWTTIVWLVVNSARELVVRLARR